MWPSEVWPWKRGMAAGGYTFYPIVFGTIRLMNFNVTVFEWYCLAWHTHTHTYQKCEFVVTLWEIWKLNHNFWMFMSECAVRTDCWLIDDIALTLTSLHSSLIPSISLFALHIIYENDRWMLLLLLLQFRWSTAVFSWLHAIYGTIYSFARSLCWFLIS